MEVDNSALPLLQQLKFVCPNKKLSIFEVLPYDDNDILVKEYCEKLVNVGYFPDLPSDEDIRRISMKTLRCSISNEAHCKIISWLMSRSQSEYFKNNMSDALREAKAIIKVEAKVFIPCFSLMPDLYLGRMTESKKTLSTLLQGLAYEGAQFTSELLVIRAIHLIKSEVENYFTNEEELKQEVQDQFSLHFIKAKMEFVKKFHIRIIDWKERTDKVLHVTPKWRRDSDNAPEVPPNRHACEILDRIESGTEHFKTMDLKSSYDKFINNLNSSTYHQQHKSSRIQKSTSPKHPQSNNGPPIGMQKPRKNYSKNSRTNSNWNHHRQRDNSNYHPDLNGQQRNAIVSKTDDQIMRTSSSSTYFTRDDIDIDPDLASTISSRNSSSLYSRLWKAMPSVF